jgi:hypothetical protein
LYRRLPSIHRHDSTRRRRGRDRRQSAAANRLCCRCCYIRAAIPHPGGRVSEVCSEVILEVKQVSTGNGRSHCRGRTGRDRDECVFFSTEKTPHNISVGRNLTRKVDTSDPTPTVGGTRNIGTVECAGLAVVLITASAPCGHLDTRLLRRGFRIKRRAVLLFSLGPNVFYFGVDLTRDVARNDISGVCAECRRGGTLRSVPADQGSKDQGDS